MTNPSSTRNTPKTPSTVRSSRNRQSQPEQVLLAHGKARELKFGVAHQETSRLQENDSQTTDRELGLERKGLDLERELRETKLRLEEREARVSELEQEMIIVSGQIDAQEQERQKGTQAAEENGKKTEAAALSSTEELGKLKERNASLDQLVRLATRDEARAKQLSSDSATHIQLLGEANLRLQAENDQLKSSIAQHLSDIEELRQEKNQPVASADSSSREESARQIDQYNALEQANSHMARELVSLSLTHVDHLRQQLASAEVKLSKLSQERAAWAVFIKENRQEFTSPREFFKSLAKKRMENASLKARLGSSEFEIKSRDRMIGELEARLEELDKERNDEFAEKIKAQGQAQIAERNRELDRRRIHMFNEQLKSYTAQAKSFCGGALYDQQKDAQMDQMKQLLDSHQDELARVQREAADLRQQLHDQSSRSPSAASRNAEKEPVLNTSLSEQIDRNEELEMELDELKDANEMLKMEVNSLQLQVYRLERDLGRGENNPSTTQVLCSQGSPVGVKQATRSSMLENLKAENGAHLKQTSKLKKGIKSGGDEVSKSLVPRESLVSSRKEVKRLEAEVTKQIKAREKLREGYREKMASYRRAIWEILGYSLEAVGNGQFRLRSALKDQSSSMMLFVPGKADGGQFEFKSHPNCSFHQSSLVVNLYDRWVHRHHSIPCFTAALTLDLHKAKSSSSSSS
ncbi:hypothetical protein PTTG_00428 [Puccinia triticina 1-1 BBBD Race 1]|uniref:Spindle assembly checkpoint component MAD1 n=1 Tax=Puccinia triticina (isolate 1-1 / race 1 (BBBD)) TaxID=630390 RepID=A0A180H370_PUCT1|nr:hypothetical protein PTTG_00428 [Puccinia triticina 1-1 BBBD Race 1]